MTDKEMNEFLESIGGLENGYYTDRPPIKDSRFFSVGVGWYPLIKDLIIDLIELGWDKQTCQVKEKFGTLRFYYTGGDDEISGMVRMAESMSGVVCEECGAPGKRRGGGWIYTACDAHTKPEHLENGDNNEPI